MNTFLLAISRGIEWLRSSPAVALAIGAIGVCLAWVYWPTFGELARLWGHDAKYSHGYLVPLFAGYLLWHRREMAAGLAPNAWGLAPLAAGLGVRLAGTVFYLSWLSEASLVLVLAGVFVLLGGWAALRWSWPGLAFLLFMLPLPYSLEVALAHPLQRVATYASVYTLQTLGFAARAEGNIIVLKDIHIAVVEACNGLSMLVIFFALSTAVAILIRRPWLDKAVILASAVPIALLCNVARITATAVLHVLAGQKLADLVFHDLAGWLMMPMALGLLWLELKAISWVLVEPRREELKPMDLLFGTGLPVGKGPRPVLTGEKK